MSNQILDSQNVDGQKKIYISPQLRDLDSVNDTQGKASTNPTENLPFSATS